MTMPEQDEALYATYLQRVPMLRSCSPEDIDRIAELGVTVTVPRGQAIIREGEAGNQFFVIT
ncbi:MAG TPA: cyclic nucleotide-binding domain-containing protein, partial [Acidimicrobiia bacterium]